MFRIKHAVTSSSWNKLDRERDPLFGVCSKSQCTCFVRPDSACFHCSSPHVCSNGKTHAYLNAIHIVSMLWMDFHSFWLSLTQPARCSQVGVKYCVVSLLSNHCTSLLLSSFLPLGIQRQKLAAAAVVSTLTGEARRAFWNFLASPVHETGIPFL